MHLTDYQSSGKHFHFIFIFTKLYNLTYILQGLIEFLLKELIWIELRYFNILPNWMIEKVGWALANPISFKWNDLIAPPTDLIFANWSYTGHRPKFMNPLRTHQKKLEEYRKAVENQEMVTVSELKVKLFWLRFWN